MEKAAVVIFKPYPFFGVSDRKVNLRCPISARELEWNRFCYYVEAREDEEWPHKG
jgi:hypothetical protein